MASRGLVKGYAQVLVMAILSYASSPRVKPVLHAQHLLHQPGNMPSVSSTSFCVYCTYCTEQQSAKTEAFTSTYTGLFYAIKSTPLLSLFLQCFSGVAGAVLLPVAGLGVGVAQVVRGAVNTPEAVRELNKGRYWDLVHQQYSTLCQSSFTNCPCLVILHSAMQEAGAGSEHIVFKHRHQRLLV